MWKELKIKQLSGPNNSGMPNNGKGAFVYGITQKGKYYLQKGFPERLLLQFLKTGGKRLNEIRLDRRDDAVYWAKKNKWIKIDGNEAMLSFFGRMSLPLQKTDAEKALSDVEKRGACNEKYAKELLNRKLMEEIGREHFSLKLKNIFWKKDELDEKNINKAANIELRILKKKFYSQQKEIRNMQDFIRALEKRLRNIEQKRQ